MAYEQGHGGRGRRRRVGRGVLLSTGVLLLVCCVGAAGLGAWNLQAVLRASGPARQAADAFLGQLVSTEPAAAYDRLCADTRARWTREAFAQRVDAPPRILRYRIGDVAVATRGGKPQGTVTAELTLESGAVYRRELTVVRDGDDWRVCGNPY
ncbi:hypothetical protein AB0J86_08485 [Micromonospora sp. NPDC049559]|uniref:Rv0361 family membrane protein n=1 Tax=Micromonospora sp. NPDC049559 TaxID=3155923 RepID=UPI003433E34B